MIITEELVCSMGACGDAMDPVKQLGIFGLTRREFIRAIKQATDDGIIPIYYYAWAAENLFKYPVIKINNDHTTTGRYRAVGVNGTIIGEYETRAEATEAALSARKEFNDKNASLHHVIARIKVEAGHRIETVDSALEIIHEVDSYDAFNIRTGVYESFATFAEAETRALELRAIEEALTDFSFAIEEEVQEVDPDDGVISDWAPLGPV